MSAPHLQWAALVLLHDPTAEGRLHADPESFGAAFGLDRAEIAQLERVDRRAWGADRFRGARLLTACLSAFPVSSAALVAQGGLDAVQVFLAAPELPRALGPGGSLRTEFAAFLRRNQVPLPFLTLELAREGLGRPPRGRAETGLWRRSPAIAVVALPEGALAAYGEARDILGEDPVTALLGEVLRLPACPTGEDSEHWLLEREMDDALALAEVGAGVAHLLAADFPGVRAAWVDRAQAAGAGGDDASALVDALIADRHLVPARGDRGMVRLTEDA